MSFLRTEIVNLVATATTGESVSLDDLVKLPGVAYNPSQYFCAYFKDEGMESKVSVFASGKMIAVGAKSEKAATRDLVHVVQILSKRGFVRNSRPRITVQNIVVTVELDPTINLDELGELIPGLVYEPEQFPGAIFRPLSVDVTVLVFASGKMVVAGLKSESSIDEIVQSVIAELGLK